MTTKELNSLLNSVREGGTLTGGSKTSGGRSVGGRSVGGRKSGGRKSGGVGFEGVLSHAKHKSVYGGGDPQPTNRPRPDDDQLWANVYGLIKGAGGADFSGGGGEDFSGGGADFSGAGGTDFSGAGMNGGIFGDLLKVVIGQATQPFERLVKHGVGKLFGKGAANTKKAKELSRDLQGGFFPFLIPVVANAVLDNLGVGKGKGGMTLAPLAMDHLGLPLQKKGGFDWSHPLLRHAVGPTDQGRRKGRGKCACEGGSNVVSTGVPLGGGGDDFSGGVGWGSDMFADYKPGDITRGLVGRPRKDKFVPSKLKAVKGSDKSKSAAEEAQEMYDEMMSGKGRHTGGKKVKSASRSAAAKARAKTNPWLQHVAAVRKENPGLGYRDVLIKAKQSY